MSYPDWVPMWLRTAMGRKCEDLAELAVPVTMKFPDGRASNVETIELTMATFGPIAWRLPDGCGDPRGVVSLVRVSPDVLVDFVACKHRPNARAVLFQKSADSELAVSAASFDARCMDAVVAQYPRTRWSLQLIYQYLCAFDGEPAENLENLVAIVRSHGKHFDVKSKKRAEPTLQDVVALRKQLDGQVDFIPGTKPIIYSVGTLSGVPLMRATWVGPVVRFEFKEARFVPQLDEVFRVGWDPRSRWKAQQQERDRGDTWIDARLTTDDYPDIEYDPAVVEHAVRLIADEMRQSKQTAGAERAKTPNVYETVRAALHAADAEMSVASTLSGAVGKVVAAGKAPVALAKVQLEALSVEPGFVDASPGEALFAFVDAADVPVGAFEVGGVRWIPKEVRHRFLFAYLATKNSSTPTVDPDSSRVQAAVALVAQAMRQQLGTVSPAERQSKQVAPPSIMVSLPKSKPGESLMLKWSAEAGALLTNANGESEDKPHLVVEAAQLEWMPSTLCARDGARINNTATAPGSPQAGIFLTPDVASDGPKTLHIPLSLMAGLAPSIYFDEHRIGAAARLEMPAVSIAFVEIDGLTFRLTGDRMSPNDASIALLDLVPVEGPSRDRNDELATKLYYRVSRANRVSEPASC